MSPARRRRARLARLAPLPAGLACGGLVVAAPAGWFRVAVTVTLGLVVAGLAPYWLAYGARARRPTDDEREAVAAAFDAPVAVRLRVAEDAAWVGNALVAGILPGQRYVFVAAELFAVLDDAECEAVVAHEVAHHSRRHVLLRHGLAVAAAGYVVALAEFAPFRLLPTVAVGFAPYLLGTAWVFRRTELAADAAAARRTDPAALARALEALVEARLVLGGGSLPGRLFTDHPPVQSRIARLRERATR